MGYYFSSPLSTCKANTNNQQTKMKFLTVAIFFAAAIAVCYGGLLAPAPAVAAYAAPAYAAYAAPAPALAYAAPYAAPYAYAAPAALREDSLVVGPSGSIASSRVSPAAVAYYG